jgi:tetratricopeptide (TPR) repeat protein
LSSGGGGDAVLKQGGGWQGSTATSQLVEIERSLGEARVYSSVENWDEAIRICNQVMQRIEPAMAIAYRTLGDALYAQNQVQDAIHYYRRVVELQPDSAADQVNLGSLYAQSQQWQEAIACYDRAIALNPTMASGYWNLAQVWQELGDLEKAADYAHQTLTLEPGWASVPEHLTLGHTLLAQGKLDAAIAAYRRTIQVDATCAAAYYSLGNLLHSQSQVEEAIECYRRAVQQDAQTPQYHYSLGKALETQGEWDQVIGCYRRMTLLEPGNPQNYLQLAEALTQQELWDQVIGCYRKLAELQPDVSQIHHKLGDLLNQTQQWEEAVTAFRRAIALNPEFSWSHNNLGDALLHLERWQEAVEALERAIALNPDFHWSHYNLAEALMQLERWDGAIGAYQRSLELQPDLPYAHRKLGDARRQRAKADLDIALECYHEAIQRNPDDIQNYHRALDINPKDLKLYAKLETALARKGQHNEAIVFQQMLHQLQSAPAITTLKSRDNSDNNSTPVVIDQPQTSSPEVRLIAFYLPQFHPIAENDQWWGKGFTEWTNVTKAKALFDGHHQPQLPSDLGFYDLRIPEVREAQAELAKKYGIYGFCYYYYWFAGKRLLYRPFDEVLASKKPDFPFCICWANENWTRRWDGAEHEVLMAQECWVDEQNRAFAEHVTPILLDERYIRINGAPILIIYRHDLFPNMLRTTEQWREIFRRNSVGEVHLSIAITFNGLHTELNCLGFDSALQFPPHGFSAREITPTEVEATNFSGKLFDYPNGVVNSVATKMPDHKLFLGTMPAWDNTARRRNTSHIFINSSPEIYEFWLRGAVEKTKQKYSGDERIVFVNAWNEWAEGAHLEPDQKFGHAYLLATRNALFSTHSWKTVINLLRHLPIETADHLNQILNQLEERLTGIDRSLKVMTSLTQQIAEVVAVFPPQSSSGLSSHIESPVSRDQLHVSSISIKGWVFSEQNPVIAVRAIADNHLLGETAVNLHRPDVAEIYTISGSKYSGFLITVKLPEIASQTQVSLQAICENGISIPLCEILLQRWSKSCHDLNSEMNQIEQLEHLSSLNSETWKDVINSIRNLSLNTPEQLLLLVNKLESQIEAKMQQLNAAQQLLKQRPVQEFYQQV